MIIHLGSADDDKAVAFDMENVYTVSFRGCVKFASLEESRLYTFFKDGRNLSELMENWFDTRFENITKADGKFLPFDLIINGNEKVELRMVTKGGVFLGPSNQLGAGRSFDASKYKAKIDALNYYIFCDTINFPDVAIYSSNAQRMFEEYPSARITRRNWERWRCLAEERTSV